jgi:uncharacterized membrane protein YraQ (UPF0718 family)/copper chaperone CopZ
MLPVILAAATEFWGVLGEMAPYLLFGFLAAGVLSVLLPAPLVERHLGGKGPRPVVKAALFGIPLPLCSCSVIPVAASLRRHGASRGATSAFLISTPQTGVDSILVTLSLLGPVFALFRSLAAFISGLLGGGATALMERDHERESGGVPACTDPCCAPAAGRGPLVRALRYGFVTLARDIGRPLVIGLAIAGVIATVVPDDYFSGLLGGGIAAMVVMLLLGIPVYVCATASVPIAAALIAKGVSPGAALVFLMTGPATNAASIATVWKVMGRRAGIVYLLTVGVTALAAGLIFDALLVTGLSSATVEPLWELPGAVKLAASLILIAALAPSLLPRLRRGSEDRESSPRADREVKELSVSGVTCAGCAERVADALRNCDGVQRATVDPSSGRAQIEGVGLDGSQLCEAVGDLGHSAEEVQHVRA